MPSEEPGEEPYDGPDPRTWPGNEDIWPLVTDIRMLDEVLETLSGKTAREIADPAYDEARRFLRVQIAERCQALAHALLDTYRIQLPGDGKDGTPADSV